MLLNAVVLLLIVLITSYLATQGMLSSIIALITAMFSSILAMALLDATEGLVASWKPDLARGVTLLALFLVAFGVTRFAADALIPENIKLPVMANRVVGGVVGFFTSLVVVGTLLVGMEMLPLPRALMSFDRYPAESTMQKTDAPLVKGKPVGELATGHASIWFSPDQFVAGMWNVVSGKSLGGNHPWEDEHPALITELYGYRNSVVTGSRRSLPPDLFNVQGVWQSTDPKDLEGLGLSPIDSRSKLVLVRVKVDKGDKDPHIANDPNEDPYFRISATQIRLVAGKKEGDKFTDPKQYYPVGYLENGQTFVPLALDSGHLVEDFAGNSLIEDWIFLINPDETPSVAEMKELGHKELADVIKTGKPQNLARNNYPPLAYLKDLSTITAKFDAGSQKIESATVYLIDEASPLSAMEPELGRMYKNDEDIWSWIQGPSHGWSNKDVPGLPSPEIFRSASFTGQTIETEAPETKVPWVQALPIMLGGRAEADPERNMNIYRNYVEETLLPMWTSAKSGSPILHNQVTADASGNATMDRIVTGDYCVVAVMKTDRGFYFWAQTEQMSKAATRNYNFSIANSAGSTIFNINLDAPAPH